MTFDMLQIPAATPSTPNGSFMRTCLALLVLSSSAISAFGQLNPLPTWSGADGVYINHAGPETASWTSSPLANYSIAPSNPFTVPAAGGLDAYGRRWTSTAPSTGNLTMQGGTLRNIFLGGSTPDVNAVGYTFSGTADGIDSFTLAYANGSYAPSGMEFGNFADVALRPYDGATFDFWVGTQNGAYTVFDPSNSTVNSAGRSQILWTEEPLLVSTYIPALGANAYVETWIVSVVEQSGQSQPPVEYRFAVQQFLSEGSTLVPIPEPATYAGLGVVICALLAARRRLIPRCRPVAQKD